MYKWLNVDSRLKITGYDYPDYYYEAEEFFKEIMQTCTHNHRKFRASGYVDDEYFNDTDMVFTVSRYIHKDKNEVEIIKISQDDDVIYEQ